MRRKGFTLIELLVVISIIAMLLSIMLPSLGKTRQTAKRVVCINNCKQWAVGCQVYVMSNDDKFPYRYNRNSLGGGSRPEGSPGNNSPQFYHNTNEQSWSYVDIWLEPYIGEPKFIYCPASKNKYKGMSYQEQIDETGLVQGDYLVYIGYDPDYCDRYTAVTWGYEGEDYNFKPYIPPLVASKATSSMAVSGCINYRYVTYNWWQYYHPTVNYDMTEPPGQSAAFADGHSEWVKFEDTAVFMHINASIVRDIWWPNPRK